MKNLEMLCNQCEMSAINGCGSKGTDVGTCGKTATLAKLQDMMIYGLKALAAYREHARQLGANTLEVDDVVNETLYFTLTNVNFTFDDHIAQLMKIGQAGVKAMDILGDAHTSRLGGSYSSYSKSK
ncbi:MAG: hydroxylamine reductase [bacterium]|jgi:hydroxylamine reductase